MILKNLRLMNYRRFESLEIDFHPRLTVIAARNGQGKTTVLEGVATALGPFIGAFDLGKADHIAATDARFVRLGDGFENEQSFPVEIGATLLEPAISWHRALNGPKSRTTTREAGPLAQMGRGLQEAIRSKPDVNLPVVAYYPSSRLWRTHKSSDRKAVLSASRTAGYEDCLSSSSSFIQVQNWMKRATTAALQQQELPGYENSNLSARIKGIQYAVDQMLLAEGWSHLHYSLGLEELAMFHPDHGVLPVTLLSDGVRAMISLAADLAFRCVVLNGHLKDQAPQMTTGIVLIDEVDLHLHPAWQQTVLVSLQRAFEQVQFIVSTHSPQVLSSVHSECIRTVDRDQEGTFIAGQPYAPSYGELSSDVLETIMLVDPYPPIAERDELKRLTEWVDQGLYDTQEARDLMDDLGSKLGEHDSVIQRLRRSIRRQEALKG